MKTLTAPIDEKILHCFESISTVEASICSSLQAVTDLIEAMDKRSKTNLFNKEELKEAGHYIVSLLKSISYIQNILLRKIKIYIHYSKKYKIKMDYNSKADHECYKIIQKLTNRIKSDSTFVSEYRENLIPTLKQISQYFDKKEKVMGTNVMGKGQTSPPWILKSRTKPSRAKR